MLGVCLLCQLCAYCVRCVLTVLLLWTYRCRKWLWAGRNCKLAGWFLLSCDVLQPIRFPVLSVLMYCTYLPQQARACDCSIVCQGTSHSGSQWCPAPTWALRTYVQTHVPTVHEWTTCHYYVSTSLRMSSCHHVTMSWRHQVITSHCHAKTGLFFPVLSLWSMWNKGPQGHVTSLTVLHLHTHYLDMGRYTVLSHPPWGVAINWLYFSSAIHTYQLINWIWP